MTDYDDVLFAVSFYLLDDDRLGEHGGGLLGELDGDVRLLSLTVEGESDEQRVEHERAFEEFADVLREAGVNVTEELRREAVEDDAVADEIASEAEDHDLLVMGHTRVRDDAEPTTAEKVINTVSVPVVVIPLTAPRFQGH
ncbi:MAG: universal stress protein [Halobacteriota archaeon]